MPIIDISKDLSALFSEQVKATPDLIALEDEARTLTYAELDTEVEDLAKRLRHYGVGRDALVGVLLGRSADYVIACLAALRAGGAFLVLELAYPPSLLGDVIDDAQPKVIITHTAHAGKVKEGHPLIVLDEQKTQPNGTNGTTEGLPDLPSEHDLDRLAFVSYSSGTTGKPKGICNPHGVAVRSYDLRFGLSDLQPGDRVACNVFFIWEILRPLLRGATVVTVPDETSYDPVALVELLRSRHITETLMTPTLLATVLHRHTSLGKRVPELRTVWLNGEVVTTDLARRALKALPNCRLLNCYSASETHEIACGDIKEMLDEQASVCPVGPPIDPEHTYILDERGSKVDVGVSGELFVGGSLLARGYLNLPETTAKAFHTDPFDSSPGARMYATGDTARLLPSGLLEITGRVGAMIKIRGYSIQPPAVEKAIMDHLAVQSCAVIAHGDGLDRRLVAYIVPDKEEPGDRTTVLIDESGYSPAARKVLTAHLAHYMVPVLWIELDNLPTHEVSGKVDHKRLPSPNARSKSPNGTPKQDREITLEDIAKVWAGVLNTSTKAVLKQQHDFFDLGGHSLALVNLVTRLTATYGFPVSVGKLAGQPTLAGHLEVVRAARDGHTAAVQSDLPAVLRADSVLPDDIRPNGAKACRLSDADTVLLTGATGFLGAFLLHTILATTEANVICLVRFADLAVDNYAAGLARIRKNLLDLGLWTDSIIDRIEVLPANVARKRFGLSPEAFDELASRVQVVIHAAATVNLVYPYASMQGANVYGTREILRLACQGGATVHHISTNGVLPPSTEGWAEDAMLSVDEVPEKLIDGYGQTKWVAEQLILEAGKRGLPARIYRPGTISGHSTSGSTNTYDLFNAIIVESLLLGYAPDIEGWFAEMTPVDFVSRAITSLADQDHQLQRVFHVGDPSPVTTKEVFGYLAQLGYPTQPMAWDQWVELWNEKRGSSKGLGGGGSADGSSFTVEILSRGMPTVDFLKWVTVLKDPATQPLLSRAGLERPKIDSSLFQIYIRHFCARGWLPKPPLRSRRSRNTVKSTATATATATDTTAAAAAAATTTTPPPSSSPPADNQATMATTSPTKGPLAGRVAVVTGASSGIGAAVATALAREGAHVALAARRADALESLRGKIVAANGDGGGKVIAHPTDVTDRAQVEALVQAAAEQLGGPVDILVACAGVMYFTLMKNAHVDEWERTVDVNCKGLLHCLSSVVPGMLARGGSGSSPHIVAISSDAGRKVFPGLGVYSASKFFVEATLQSLRLETAGSGLRVTAVQPGNTSTDLLGMSTDQEAVKKYGEPSGARILDPEDVASAIVYALRQPAHVAVNEILIEPRDEPI
ncbi:putative NRPS-like protein biosynthetic cluster [Diatrype stigma]|uniref:NRPS-like protein biosynthetic cluster n=1 Tax=Diatrype stigma TaxID=117547 RepID=A0AAN9YTP6_9PEZI